MIDNDSDILTLSLCCTVILHQLKFDYFTDLLIGNSRVGRIVVTKALNIFTDYTKCLGNL